jgi:hypothetical protein
MCDQRAGKLDSGCNQKPIRRIALRKMMKPVAAASGAMTERHGFDAGTFEESRHPCLNRQVQALSTYLHNGIAGNTRAIEARALRAVIASNPAYLVRRLCDGRKVPRDDAG